MAFDYLKLLTSFYCPVPDGKPMIGPVPGMTNVFLATGHEGEGLSLVIFKLSCSAKEYWDEVTLFHEDLLILYPCAKSSAVSCKCYNIADSITCGNVTCHNCEIC